MIQEIGEINEIKVDFERNFKMSKRLINMIDLKVLKTYLKYSQKAHEGINLEGFKDILEIIEIVHNGIDLYIFEIDHRAHNCH